jgi:hypothetical protein
MVLDLARPSSNRVRSRAHRVLRLVRVASLRALSRRSPRRWWVLLVALPVLAGWQLDFWRRGDAVKATRYKLEAAVGLKDQQPLVYFYHHLGLYPLASTLPALPDSREGAKKVIAEQGHTLIMEVQPQILGPLRIGDHGRLLLYLPDVWARGKPEAPAVWRTNAVAFLVALSALFFSFWWRGWPVLGGLLVLFIGSNPYQLYEVYGNDNIFGWSITLLLLMLALYLPVIDPRGPRSRVLFALPVITGLVVGTFHHIRSEPTLLLLSALGATALMSRATFKWRALMAATLIAVSALTSIAWGAYFRRVISHTHEVVKNAGGKPHPGALAPEMHHNVWMAVWDGLGDFDTKYGYAWDDRKAHAYAQKALRERHGIEYPYWPGDFVFPGSYLDDKQTYIRVPFQMPHYHEVLRAKVLGDITRDPLWYAGILARRVWAGLTDLTPLKVKLANRWLVDLDVMGFVALPVVALVVWTRRAAWLGQLLLFSLPLSLPALLVFSKRGMTYVSTYHLVAAAILANLVLASAHLAWLRRRRRRDLSDRALAAAGVGAPGELRTSL